MQRINEFNLEPGPYGNAKGFKVVVTDVVNHNYDTAQELPNAIPNPIVICRDLTPPSEHRVYMIDLEYFKHHFFPLT